MSSAFYPKSSLAMDRSLKVQSLSIPLTVTSSATPASVVLGNDEPSVLFLQSQGVNQITAADSVAAAEYADTTPTDASGQLNVLIVVGESVQKVMCARLRNRITGAEYALVQDGGSTQGVSSSGNIMLSVASTVNFTSASLDACLDIEYVVADGN